MAGNGNPRASPSMPWCMTFPQDAAGKAIPYGIYDMASNEAWVSVGRDHDTPAFAVASLRQWWNEMGRHRYPEAGELFITADAGGSNGYRSRAWKHGLQQFADETGVRIEVSHFPPGTSKWNKIEHRLFCHITQNWRGKVLRTFAVKDSRDWHERLPQRGHVCRVGRGTNSGSTVRPVDFPDVARSRFV